ncbi:Phospholipase/carboxylesterase/thioesterase [Trinorchestia longiramus]|nr:Phospholipase/carboxylesterase/thioesterase [Trinorchestia longiramus]
MGGAVALHVGYRSRRGIAGVFALSAFLNSGSAVYQALDTVTAEERSFLPPLYQTHGVDDTLVLPSWGVETNKQLTKRGVLTEFLSVPHCCHSLHKAAVEQVLSWASEKLA